MSLRAVARRIAAREVSPIDLTRRMLARIAMVDPVLKSYATVMGDQAIADAEKAASEIAAGRYRGPLHGVPIGIKDLCYTKGVRTMGGLAVRRDFVPSEDATVVTRLRTAGAVVLGKTNLSEGAAAGYNPAMDVPLNPWNHDRWPGMSSSGSGVALAAGLCFGAVGTDTGGSIRNPSSANGVVGLKPTYGRVSRFGVMPMAPSLDHVGPMAREVADVAILFDAMAGRDPADPTSLDAPPAEAVKALGGGVRGLRIGVDRAYALVHTDAGQARAIEAALKVLERQGAVITPVRMPDLSDLVPTWAAICGAEIAAAHAATYPSRAAEYGPYLREFLETGASVTPQELAAARRRRAQLTAQMDALLDTVDAMAGPAGGDPAWPITHALQTGPLPAYHRAWGAAQPRSAEFTMPMDLAGAPAICLPCGVSADGLPYSIQFTGRRLSEALLCRVAFAYEQATDWHNRHPQVQA
ncbi:amidase [Phenylobacterium sp.]|uniref:amidase n=1 Tax=Phenylobacterium sp. TaxID=1871053 RepID=UPI00261AAF25|nr:amidase [Phenylobacterium sp.]